MSLDMEAIKARETAATEGPWAYGSDWTHYCVAQVLPGGNWAFLRIVESANQNSARDFSGADYYGVRRKADAEFIAHARTDIPALVNEVESLRSELASRSGRTLDGVIHEAPIDFDDPRCFGWSDGRYARTVFPADRTLDGKGHEEGGLTDARDD